MEKYFDINESGYSVRCKLYCGNVHDINKAVIFGHGFGGHMDNKACEKFTNSFPSTKISASWPSTGPATETTPART